jgi:anti-sigma-K factor RskA
MNLHQHPELLDRLSAAYALGTLRGGARRRLETLARQNAAVRAPILLWQERIKSLTEIQKEVAPSGHVWTRISNLVDVAISQSKAVMDPPAFDRLKGLLRWWRGATVATALAGVAAIGIGIKLERDLRNQPLIEYVAVLADKESSPNVLVTFDPRQKRLTLKRLNDYSVADDRSMQLWALPKGSTRPVSLGVLDSDAVIRLEADSSRIRDVLLMEISLEPKGGVPSERGPTGPILFKGNLLQTGV